MCASTAEQPMVRVCALLGLPGGRWQIVHFFGSDEPSKSGVGDGFSAFAIGAAIQKPKENKTPATITSADPQIRRNCAPLVTTNNFLIKPFIEPVSSILSARCLGQQKSPPRWSAEANIDIFAQG